MGYELLSKWDSTRPYAEAALYHHLWYDEKGGYPREYTHKGNDNAILYQILTCADCLGAATDSVGNEFVKMIFVSFLNSNIYPLKNLPTSRVCISLETPYSKASSHFPIASH